MSFEYACFISYAHANEALMTRFISDLRRALASSLEPHLDQQVFLDDTRLKAGYRYNEALAAALCRSACWIVVYVPRYGRHAYCRREFRAMCDLEARRRRLLGDKLKPEHGMIIPIVLRGREENLPARIRDSIHYLDFRNFSTAQRSILANPGYMAKIDDVAEYIATICDLGESVGGALSAACGEFQLPDDSTDDWSSAPPSFPGRQ